MITCPLCGPRRTKTFPAGWEYPKARVVETRKVGSHVTFRGKSTRTKTIKRVRECLECRYRWTTIEYVQAARRGRKTLFGKPSASSPTPD